MSDHDAVLRKSIRVTLTGRQRDAVRAALRYYHQCICRIPDDIEAIATNAGVHDGAPCRSDIDDIIDKLEAATQKHFGGEA